MSDQRAASAPPDGIQDEHLRPHVGLRRHASPLGLIVLTVLLLAALVGLAGHESTRSATGAGGVELEWQGPQLIRNGEFFENRVHVRADRPVEELTIGIEASLWEDLTINTMFPGASEERSEDGELRFVFGALPAGEEFLLKIDGQVNPDILGGNEGTVTVYDGDRPLVALPVSIEVLP